VKKDKVNSLLRRESFSGRSKLETSRHTKFHFDCFIPVGGRKWEGERLTDEFREQVMRLREEDQIKVMSVFEGGVESLGLYEAGGAHADDEVVVTAPIKHETNTKKRRKPEVAAMEAEEEAEEEDDECGDVGECRAQRRARARARAARKSPRKRLPRSMHNFLSSSPRFFGHGFGSNLVHSFFFTRRSVNIRSSHSSRSFSWILSNVVSLVHSFLHH